MKEKYSPENIIENREIDTASNWFEIGRDKITETKFSNGLFQEMLLCLPMIW